jgi:hypothetical protein
VAGAAAFGGYVFVGGSPFGGPPPVPAEGSVTVNSKPEGLAVVVNGRDRGVTPLTLKLPPGEHSLQIRAAGETREIALDIAPGAQVSHYFDLPDTTLAGQLEVSTEPSGARVTVDGTLRGVSPLTIADLAPGVHTVVLENERGSVQQQVNIQAGATAALVVPLSATESHAAGWVEVTAPVEMQIFQRDRLIGTTASQRIMMPAGRHEVRIVNESLGFEATRTVQVSPGRVSGVNLALPSGVIHLNATPWAEVWIDGQRAGETPLGNLSIPIGPHEIVFRHPQFGERRHAVTVSLNAPTRLSVDLRQ